MSNDSVITREISKDEFLKFISGMPENTIFDMMSKMVYSDPPVYIWTVNFTMGGSNLADWKKKFNKPHEHQVPNTNYPALTIRLTNAER